MLARNQHKRKQVKTACTVCARGKRACDGNFPCGRCVRLGKENECLPVVRRRRIPRSPYDEFGPETDASPPPHALPPGSGLATLHSNSESHFGGNATQESAGGAQTMPGQGVDALLPSRHVMPAAALSGGIGGNQFAHPQHIMSPSMLNGTGGARMTGIALQSGQMTQAAPMAVGIPPQLMHQHPSFQYAVGQRPQMAPLPTPYEYSLMRGQQLQQQQYQHQQLQQQQQKQQRISSDVQAAAAALVGAIPQTASEPTVPTHVSSQPWAQNIPLHGDVPGSILAMKQLHHSRAPSPQHSLAAASALVIGNTAALPTGKAGTALARAAGTTSQNRQETDAAKIAPLPARPPIDAATGPISTFSAVSSGASSPRGLGAPEQSKTRGTSERSRPSRGPSRGGHAVTVGVGAQVPLMAWEALELEKGLQVAATLATKNMADLLTAVADLNIPAILMEYADTSTLHPDDVAALMADPSGLAPPFDSSTVTSGSPAPETHPPATKSDEPSDHKSSPSTSAASTVVGHRKRDRPDSPPPPQTAVPAAKNDADDVDANPNNDKTDHMPKRVANGVSSSPAAGDACAITEAATSAADSTSSSSSSAAAAATSAVQGIPADSDDFDDDDNDDDDQEPVMWQPIVLESNEAALRLFNNTREQVIADATAGIELPWIHPHEAMRRATIGIKATSRRLTRYSYDGLYVSRVTPAPGSSVTREGAAIVPFTSFRATEVLIVCYDGKSSRIKRSLAFFVGAVPTGVVLPIGTIVTATHLNKTMVKSADEARSLSSSRNASAAASPREFAAISADIAQPTSLQLPESQVAPRAAVSAAASAVSAAAASTATQVPAASDSRPSLSPTGQMAANALALAHEHIRAGNLDMEPRVLHSTSFQGALPQVPKSQAGLLSTSSSAARFDTSQMLHQSAQVPVQMTMQMQTSSGRPLQTPSHMIDDRSLRHPALYSMPVGNIARLMPWIGSASSINERDLPASFMHPSAPATAAAAAAKSSAAATAEAQARLVQQHQLQMQQLHNHMARHRQ